MKGPNFFRTVGILVFLFLSRLLYAQGTTGPPHFKTLDADKDSRISYAEFYKGMDSALLFEKWDSSHDGVLDRQELYDIIGTRRRQEARGVVLEASYAGRVNTGGRTGGQESEAGELQLLRSFFRLADLNRDHRLNKAEFYLFLFRQYDTDKNGSLIFNEYAQESRQ